MTKLECMRNFSRDSLMQEREGVGKTSLFNKHEQCSGMIARILHITQLVLAVLLSLEPIHHRVNHYFSLHIDLAKILLLLGCATRPL